MNRINGNNQRAEVIAWLLHQVSENKDMIFACRDRALRQGCFESISTLDANPRNIESPIQIDALLKARAEISLRLKVAERIKEKLEF